MRIALKDLPTQLSPTLSKPLFVFGDEPVLHQEAIELIQRFAKQHHFERERFDIRSPSDWLTVQSELSSQNLFSSKRLLECRIEGSVQTKILMPLLEMLPETLPSDTLLLIRCAKVEPNVQKTNYFKKIEHQCITVGVTTLTPNDTLRYIRESLTKAGFTPDPELVQLLFERTEGNLIATRCAIEQLKLLHPSEPIATHELSELISINTRFSVFALVDALLSGSLQRTTQILNRLQQEGVEPILVLWAITKEIRTILLVCDKLKKGHPQSRVFTEHGIWRRREGLVSQFINRVVPNELQTVLIEAKSIDDVIKGRTPGNPWRSLTQLCLHLTEMAA